jgi:hypothetical protein
MLDVAYVAVHVSAFRLPSLFCFALLFSFFLSLPLCLYPLWQLYTTCYLFFLLRTRPIACSGSCHVSCVRVVAQGPDTQRQAMGSVARLDIPSAGREQARAVSWGLLCMRHRKRFKWVC